MAQFPTNLDDSLMALPFIKCGTLDPSVVPTYGAAGTIYIMASRPPTASKLFQKEDDGTTTNWVLFSALAPVPPGPVAPVLLSSSSFAVLGASAVSNTGPTLVTGNLGSSPTGSITGFPPGTVSGATHSGDATAATAQTDLFAAYNDAASRPFDTNLTGIDLGGLTLTPGVYKFSTSAQLTGVLTLDAQNNPNAVWIFQIGSTLTTASASSVVMINGGVPGNVFWQVGSSATFGTTTTFLGNVLALVSITATTGANFTGRLFAHTGAVTLDTNNVTAVAGSTPVFGDVNTIAFFNALGVLTDDLQFQFHQSLKSMSMGPGNTASGQDSLAIGSNNTASGPQSQSFGNDNIASGNHSQARGTQNTASGGNSTVEGLNNTSSGQSSHAEGNLSTSSAWASHAEGESAASAEAAHAEGAGTLASGYASHSEGSLTISSAGASHAEGGGSQATANNAHAEGNSTTASGGASHSEGSANIASGISAHSEGDSTVASGNNSHAAGFGTVAHADEQTAVGSFNVPVGTPGTSLSTDELFTVGNGVLGTPSTAFAVLRNGTIDAHAHAIVNVVAGVNPTDAANVSQLSQRFTRIATATPDTVSATTDYFVGVNVAAAAVVNLPAGVDGMEYIIKDVSGNALVNNITVVPNGADTIEGAASYLMAANYRGVTLIFKTGVWYLTSIV
jgi:hypothetical protein